MTLFGRSGILEKCKRILFWNPAETIGKNPLKLQMTLFCCCGKIKNDPILPQYMNPTKTIKRSPLTFADDPILSL